MAVNSTYLFQAYYETVKNADTKRLWYAIIKAKGMWAHLPMMTEEAPIKKGHRVIDQLPTVQSGPVGFEPTPQGWQPSREFQEGAFLWRNNFPIDSLMTKFKNTLSGGDPITINSKAYLIALALNMDNLLINADQVQGLNQDIHAFTGLKYRILNTSGPGGTSQYGVNPACNVQSVGASLIPSSWSAVNAGRIWLDFDRVMNHMDSENGDRIICYAAPQTLWLLDELVKVSSPAAGFSITQDVFNRTVRKYKQMEIVECSLQPPAVGGLQVTPIISVSDDVAGWGPGDPAYNPTGTTFFTSFYFIKRGSGKADSDGGLTAWNVEEPWARVEHLPTTRQMAWMYDMTAGLFYEDTRAIARLYGVQVVGPSLN